MNSTSFEDGYAALEHGDLMTALEILRPLAIDGNANAQWTLGFMYHTGRGVPEDSAEAFKWYHKAADQGNAGTQKLLGDIYAGKGDVWESAKWYRKAADQGDANAQFQLGEFYGVDNEDRHLRYDRAESVRWYRRAADQGHTDAQYMLGLICEGNSDDSAAASWYRKAAEKGHGDAQYEIGKMYLEGCGVEKNFVQAYKWLTLAAISDNTEDPFPARADCESLAENMTQAQMDEAQTLIDKWKSGM